MSHTELWNSWENKQKLEQAYSNKNDSNTGNWQSTGPFSFTDIGSWGAGQGRVNVVMVDPNDTNTYYMGAPAACGSRLMPVTLGHALQITYLR